MRDHFKMFSAYNAWANGRLYASAGALSEEDYRKDCAVAFTSMHGTLNHILVADQIWMRRFTGEGPAPDTLDAIVCKTFDALSDERRTIDARIQSFLETVPEEVLSGTFTYTPMTTPEPVTMALAPALSHIFNHQTHHRGQAHAILTRLVGEAPPMDLIYFLLDHPEFT